MKRNTFSVSVIVFTIVLVLTGCSNGNEDEQTTSPYSGTWQSTVYEARIIIELSTSLTATLQLRENSSSPWVNAAKGSLVIVEPNVTLTYTHVWKNNMWSDNPADIIEMAPVIGSSPMPGTVNGSTVGSIIFDNFVKQ